jgi:biopolymer transport protein ExbD
MQVGSQIIVPGRFQKHLVARQHAKRSAKRTILLALSLTSMVDMFSLLVIFLLQTFSTSPEMLMVSKEVKLPVAQSGREIVDAPVLAVTKEGVFLDQKLIGQVDQVLQNPDGFMERLKNLRELWQKTHPQQKFTGEMNLQAHKEISSAVVAKIMGMLPTQNYDSIQLIVTSGGN